MGSRSTSISPQRRRMRNLCLTIASVIPAGVVYGLLRRDAMLNIVERK